MKKRFIIAIVIALTLESVYSVHAEDFSVSDAQIVDWQEAPEELASAFEEEFPSSTLFEEEIRSEETEFPVEIVQAAEGTAPDQEEISDNRTEETISEMDESPTDSATEDLPEDAGTLSSDQESVSDEENNQESEQEPLSDEGENQESEQKEKSIKNCTVVLKDTLICTGKPLKQKYSVYDAEGYLLREGKDYKAENLNNVNIGTGTLKITGIGNYKGTIKKKYQITLGKVQLGTVESVAYDQLKLTWKKLPGADGYYVYIKSGKSWKKIGTTKNTSFTHKSSKKYPLKTGVTYTYTIKAYGKSGKKTIKGSADQTGMKGKAIPGAPEIVNVQCTQEGRIMIRWKSTPGATHYIVMRKGAKGKWKEVKTLKGNSKIGYVHVSSSEFPIKKGKTYTYTVRSYNSKGKTYGGFDKNGIKVKALSEGEVEVQKATENAEKLVKEITNNKMSDSEKLLACFRWVMSKPYVTRRSFQRVPGWTGYYANDHFLYGGGDCHSDACAFAYLAKALGYTNIYVCTDSNVPSRGHSWTEINGLAYDPLFAEAKSFSKYYGVTSRAYPLTAITKQKI